MYTKSDELKEIFNKMSQEEFGIYIDGKFDKLQNKIEINKRIAENDRWIKVTNGSIRKQLLKDYVAEMGNDIKQIKDDISPLREFSIMHRSMKKFKIYWIMGILLSGAIIKEIIFIIIGR